MRLVVETSLDEEEMTLIKTLNPAGTREAVRRCKAKASAYLRRAELIEAWGKKKGQTQ